MTDTDQSSNQDEVLDHEVDLLEPLDEDDEKLVEDISDAKKVLNALNNPIELNDSIDMTDADINKLYTTIRGMNRKDITQMLSNLSLQSHLSDSNQTFCQVSEKGRDERRRKLREKLQIMREKRMGQTRMLARTDKQDQKKSITSESSQDTPVTNTQTAQTDE